MDPKDVIALKAHVMHVRNKWVAEHIAAQPELTTEVIALTVHLLTYRPEVFKNHVVVDELFAGASSPAPKIVLARLYKLFGTIRVT